MCQAAQSPTAKTPSMLVAPCSSQRIASAPLSPRSSPDPASQPTTGAAPMPSTTVAAGIRLPLPRITSRPAAPTRTPSTRACARIVTPCCEVQVGDRVRVGSEGGPQRNVVGDDEGDLAAELTGGRRHLRSDEAAADHHDRPAGGDGIVQVLPQRGRIVEGAQQVHAGQPDAGHRGPRRSTGGDHDPVAGHRGAVAQLRPRHPHPAAAAERRRAHPAARWRRDPRPRPPTTARPAHPGCCRNSLDSGGRS